ncbi:hypothetical protein OHC33_008982 [Knufia fluminis]|uniref:Uncharacterized protein n=1 Tax=Knufia fluminis TaxID=191047 RepID=A0AAN8F2K9_9EURO|nr:hypothetical protein OHC33_008982 [Knufia fluminis]
MPSLNTPDVHILIEHSREGDVALVPTDLHGVEDGVVDVECEEEDGFLDGGDIAGAATGLNEI